MTKTQRSIRTSGLTDQQLEEIGDRLQMSITEIVTVAVDRFYAQEIGTMNEIRIDTRNDSPHQIGGDLADGAGFDPADFNGVSNAEIAQQVADFYREQNTKLVDFDDAPMDIADYVERWLEK